MAKKIICIIVLLLALVCVLASCVNNDTPNTPDNPTHIHNYDEWETTQTATCMQAGIESRYCDCGETQTRTISKAAHVYDAWEVTKDANCTENGSKERFCNCGDRQTAEISATGHSYGDWALTKKATCTENGTEERTCICGKRETQTIPLTNHTYSNSYLLDSTVHWKECEFCGHQTAKENHNMGNDGTCIICGKIVGDTPGIVYEISSDGTYASVIGYIGTASKVKIAETYNGVPVKYIAKEAFKFADIQSIIISDRIVSIGSRAFQQCYYLTDVTLGNGLTSIDEFAFVMCSGLMNIKFGNSLISIGDDAFNSCTHLERVSIPDSVTSIGNSAFEDCSSLTSVVIGKNVKSIGLNAFYYCESLESITIPASVTTIEAYAFSFCNNLTSVTFEDPDGWSYYSFLYGSGQIVSANLQNPFTAAKYLTHTYNNHNWYKEI